MIKTKNPFYKVLLIAVLILSVGVLVLSFFNIFGSDSGTFMRFSGAFAAVAAASGFYYIVTGYTKAHAEAYKVFAACFVLSVLSDVIGVGTDTSQSILIALLAIIFGLTLVIVIGKDLGEGNSKILCTFIVVLSIAAFILTLIINPDTLRGSDTKGILHIIRSGANLVLSVILAVATFGKYIDKSRRDSQ